MESYVISTTGLNKQTGACQRYHNIRKICKKKLTNVYLKVMKNMEISEHLVFFDIICYNFLQLDLEGVGLCG